MAESLGTIRGQMVLDVQKALENFTAVRNANLATVTALRTGGGALVMAGAGMMAVGAGLLSVIGGAVSAAADFERQLDFFGAVANATEKEMEAVRVKALQLGQDTIFSAGQIADSFVELGKAGVGANDIINGVGEAVVNLGAAADIPLDTAANIILAAVQTFQLGADQAVHVADLLAGAANASIVEVEDLGVSLKYVGGIASGLGIPIEEVIDALALLGTYGIKGSTAGTALRQTLLSLGGTSQKATNELRELGIITEDGSNKFYTSEGKAKSLSEIFQILQDATKGLTDEQRVAAFRTIFQSRALSTALSLTKEGAAGFAEMNAEIGKTTAMDVASARLDNLSGDLEILRGNIETLTITQGAQLQEFFRTVVQGLTDAVQWFSDLNPEVQKAIIWFTAISGVVLVLAGFLVTFAGSILIMLAVWKQVAPALAIIRVAVLALNTSLWGTVAALLANPVTWIVLAIIALIAVIVYLWNTNEGFRNAMITAWEAIKKAVSVTIDWFKGLPKWFQDRWNTITDGVTRLRDNIINFFTSIPDRLYQLFLNFTLVGLLIQHWDSIWATISLVWNNILLFFQGLPARIGAFFAELPSLIGYWIGFMIGTVIRLLVEFGTNAWLTITTAWDSITLFFSELPGKLLQFFTDAKEWVTLKFTEMATFLVEKSIEIYNGVVDWFQKLPGRVEEFIINLVFSAKAKFLELKDNLIAKALEIYNGIVLWIQQLPAKVLEFFQTTYDNVKTKFEEVKTKAAEIALDLYNGVIDEVTKIPDKVKEIFEDAIAKVTGLVDTAKNAVKDFGSSMWNGFKDGLGIHSPSYIERAMWQITDVLDEETQRMKHQVKTIQGLGNGLAEPSFGLSTEGTTKALGLIKSQLEMAQDYQNQLAGVASTSSESYRMAASTGTSGATSSTSNTGAQVSLQVDWHAAPNDTITNAEQAKRLLSKSIDLLGDEVETLNG